MTSCRYKHQILLNLLVQLNQKQNSGCAAGKGKGYKRLYGPPTILLSSVRIKKKYSLADSNPLLCGKQIVIASRNDSPELRFLGLNRAVKQHLKGLSKGD